MGISRGAYPSIDTTSVSCSEGTWMAVGSRMMPQAAIPTAAVAQMDAAVVSPLTSSPSSVMRAFV